jgi:hypothetical protein
MGGTCILYRTAMLNLKITDIISTKVGDGNVQAGIQSG